MRDLDQSKALSTVEDTLQHNNLLQLASPEMLAISQPPRDFPIPDSAPKGHIVPALHEIETLRRECNSLKDQVSTSCLWCSMLL